MGYSSFGVCNPSDVPWRECLPTVSYVPVSVAVEVFHYLTGVRITPKQVYRMISKGRIKAIHPGGGVMLIRPCDIRSHKVCEAAAERARAENIRRIEAAIAERRNDTAGVPGNASAD